MKLVTIIVLFLTLVGVNITQAQINLSTDPNTGKVAYTGVVTATGQSKDVLFDKAKKWLQTKSSESNPYTITFENEGAGNITGRGMVSMPARDRNYVLVFAINIDTKDGKFRYCFTDLVIKFITPGGASTGGYGMWSSTTIRESEVLEYTIETFYPIRLEKRRKPSIKWFEEINKKTFENIDREMRAIEGSLISYLKERLSNW